MARDTTRYRDLPITPLYPFGHGLSYTSFTYDDLSLAAPTITGNDEITIRARITNTGARPGEEVVQLYIRDPVASVARPPRQLRGFQRIALAPGESRNVTFVLRAAQVAHWIRRGAGWLNQAAST